MLDNLKPGVVRLDLHEATINRAYAELERHCRFTVEPAKVGTLDHKGKVERQVPVVRQQLVAGRSPSIRRPGPRLRSILKHHIVFERSYYSLPTRFVGQTVWVPANRRLVEILCDEELVKTHARAKRHGKLGDRPERLPPWPFSLPIRSIVGRKPPNSALMLRDWSGRSWPTTQSATCARP